MFLFQHPEDYLRSLDVERERREHHDRLLRELRGATSRSGEGEARHSVAAPTKVSYSGPERRAGMPCPELKEAMTP
jgi:hypothetical protein